MLVERCRLRWREPRRGPELLVLLAMSPLGASLDLFRPCAPTHPTPRQPGEGNTAAGGNMHPHMDTHHGCAAEMEPTILTIL